jgi:hypothetical protein
VILVSIKTSKVRNPYFLQEAAVLAKITSKNQLTLPKSVTLAVGPAEYFDVQTRDGQIVLTPVRIQRGDAVRAKQAMAAWALRTRSRFISVGAAGGKSSNPSA